MLSRNLKVVVLFLFLLGLIVSTAGCALIGPEAFFEINDFEMVPNEFEEGEGGDIEISAQVENIGGKSGQQHLRLFYEGDQIDIKRDFTLDTGEKKDVVFAHEVPAGLEPEKYELEIRSEDDSDGGILYIFG